MIILNDKQLDDIKEKERTIALLEIYNICCCNLSSKIFTDGSFKEGYEHALHDVSHELMKKLKYI